MLTLPTKRTVFGDADDATVHGRFDAAFDDQRIAIENFSAFELDLGADDYRASSTLSLADDSLFSGCRCWSLHRLNSEVFSEAIFATGTVLFMRLHKTGGFPEPSTGWVSRAGDGVIAAEDAGLLNMYFLIGGENDD